MSNQSILIAIITVVILCGIISFIFLPRIQKRSAQNKLVKQAKHKVQRMLPHELVLWEFFIAKMLSSEAYSLEKFIDSELTDSLITNHALYDQEQLRKEKCLWLLKKLFEEGKLHSGLIRLQLPLSGDFLSQVESLPSTLKAELQKEIYDLTCTQIVIHKLGGVCMEEVSYEDIGIIEQNCACKLIIRFQGVRA